MKTGETGASDAQRWIEVEGARQHNLKNLSFRLPKNQLIVVTGPSGSGKSSLAFNTLFAEGQRRYMESLSTYVRQFLDKQEKPDVDHIRGLSPTLAIEQKNHTKNSRSTVGTQTEIYDYLRLLFSKLGIMKDPESGELVTRDVVRNVADDLMKRFVGHRAYIVFPVDFPAKSKIGDRRSVLKSFLGRGFSFAFATSPIKGRDLGVVDLQEELNNKTSPLTGKAGKASQVFVSSDRGVLEPEWQGRLEQAIGAAYTEGFGRARVWVLDEDQRLVFEGLYTEFPSVGSGEKRFPELSPLLFSFNSPVGACEHCKGFGNILTLDPGLVIPNPKLSIAQGAIEPLTKPSHKEWLRSLLSFCQKSKIPMMTSWELLSESDRSKIWNGTDSFPGVTKLFEDLEEQRYKMQVRVFLSRYKTPRTCRHCSGSRLREAARHTFVKEHTIGQITAMSVEQALKWFKDLDWSPTEKLAASEIVRQIVSRLEFLERVGLKYLTLNRLARTLSGGEAQRIALANQLGSRLTQTLYVLDEPSIGLHPRDTERLIGIMKDLVLLRNTVLVVEHDPDIIRAADHLLDLGPEAGEAGGSLLYNGPWSAFLDKPREDSLTWQYLTGHEKLGVPQRRRLDRLQDRSRKVQWLKLESCQENNLRNVDLKIPIGMLTCITGVSGSGKSTAIRRTLYPALSRIFMGEIEEVGRFSKISGFEPIRNVLLVDQEPIGRSPRSNPITFMKAYDEVRALLASTDEARRRRFHAGHFSFNVPGGRCDTCEGDGAQRVEMVFMEDLFLPCEICEGKRFKPEVLEVRYKSKNVHEILQLTVTQARQFFAGENRLVAKLKVLEQVGLGYLRLGQSSNTLSGGESQRLKIARELCMAETQGTLYVLDEPTTGLHFRDVAVLSRVLHQLVENGNTVVVIEHNLEVMKSSDWIIDFGPEGGDQGGKIVFEGTPEDMVKKSKGHTARYLKPVLEKAVRVSVPEYLGESL